MNTSQQPTTTLNDFASFLPTLISEAQNVGLTIMAPEKIENGSELYVVACSDGNTAGHVQVAGISVEVTSPLMFPLASCSMNGFGAIEAINVLRNAINS